MMRLVALAICAGLLLGAPAHAQPSEPGQSAPPAAPDYGLPINNEQAKAAAGAALAEAKKNNWRMAVTVVGPQGEMVYFEKMDGTQNASESLATAKARTSALYRRLSKIFADAYAAGNLAFTTFPERPVASEGGIPIVVNGRIVGAIGVAGGTGQQDGVAATAGATAVK